MDVINAATMFARIIQTTQRDHGDILSNPALFFKRR